MKKLKILVVLTILSLFLPFAVLAQGGGSGVGLITGPAAGEASMLFGAGASFPRPLYDVWFATADSAYTKLTKVVVSYDPQGSGYGISNIQNQSINFGATDSFMTDAQLGDAKGGPILHIPAALGGVTLSYNIEGLTEPLQLTAENIAMMYFGVAFEPKDGAAWYTDYKPLERWSDERLVANNPQLKDIDQPITVVRRADSSGTTNIFTSYLELTSQQWAEQVGPGANAIRWPTGLAGRQNPGVAAAIQQNAYSIGYIEASYALSENLPTAKIQNKAGIFVEATQASVSAAAAGVPLKEDLRMRVLNADGADSYPISGFTWLLIYQNQPDPAMGLALSRLAWWELSDGQVIITDAGKLTEADKDNPQYVLRGYAPLPLPVILQAQRLLGTMKCGDGTCLPPELLAAIQQK